MRPKHPSRHFINALNLTVQTISHTPSPPQSSRNPNAGSNGEANAGNLSSTNDGTYVVGPRTLL
jgi:hypothetical protein